MDDNPVGILKQAVKAMTTVSEEAVLRSGREIDPGDVDERICIELDTLGETLYRNKISEGFVLEAFNITKRGDKIVTIANLVKLKQKT